MRHPILFLSFALIFYSCRNSSDDSITVYKVAEEGFQESITRISRSSELVYNDMKYKMTQPELSEMMKTLRPRALKVKELSDSMANYIEKLKEELVREAGPGDKDKFERNLSVTDHLFNSHGKGKELFEKLIKYRQEILAIDSGSRKVFENKLVVFTKDFDAKKEGVNGFTKTFFDDMPGIAAMVILSNFENNIKTIENSLLLYYNSRYCLLDIRFDSFFTPLVSTSCTQVNPGVEIEITAGMGGFSVGNNFTISVNGEMMDIVNGVAVFKIKSRQKAGQYNVPIQFEYFRQDGEKEIRVKNISYTVVK